MIKMYEKGSKTSTVSEERVRTRRRALGWLTVFENASKSVAKRENRRNRRFWLKTVVYDEEGRFLRKGGRFVRGMRRRVREMRRMVRRCVQEAENE